MGEERSEAKSQWAPDGCLVSDIEGLLEVALRFDDGYIHEIKGRKLGKRRRISIPKQQLLKLRLTLILITILTGAGRQKGGYNRKTFRVVRVWSYRS
jgi:hypothetical protein